MQRGLYDKSLIVILPDIINGKITLESLNKKLPINILDDIRDYLSLFPIERFYKSIVENRDIVIVKFYMNQLLNDGKRSILNRGLKLAAKKENMVIINLLINNGATDLTSGIIGAARAGNSALVKIFINKKENIPLVPTVPRIIPTIVSFGKEFADPAMIAATKAKNMELILFFIEKGANDFDSGLKYSILTGDINLINFFLTKTISQLGWNDALAMAIRVNNKEVISLAFKNNITNYDKALNEAIIAKNLELANFLQNNSNNFKEDPVKIKLLAAIKSKNIELIDQFINDGATNYWIDAFYEASKTGELTLIKYFKQFIGKDDKVLLRALKIIIDKKYFNIIDEFIPSIPTNIELYAFGPEILYFIQNIFFPTKHGIKKGINIIDLLPLAKKGYILKQTLKELLQDNISYNIISEAFGNIPSIYTYKRNYPPGEINELGQFVIPIYQGIIKNPVIERSNLRNISAIDNIKEFYDIDNMPTNEKIDKFIILNKFKRKHLPIEVINALDNIDIKKLAWKEYIIYVSQVYT